MNIVFVLVNSKTPEHILRELRRPIVGFADEVAAPELGFELRAVAEENHPADHLVVNVSSYR